MNVGLKSLQPFPFEKLNQLKASSDLPPEMLSHINLSIGEPKHAAPATILEVLANELGGISSYPKTRGSDALRHAITRWLVTRFPLNENSLLPEKHVLPVNGTREALFSFAQCVIDNTQPGPIVIMPNPYYQIYEDAALLARAKNNLYQLYCREQISARLQQCVCA